MPSPTTHDPKSWDHPREGETETQQLDRNWSELLQELRVVQTGVQLLTGFLLTLPFQQRFTSVSRETKIAYLVTVGFSAGATIALVAPVSIHRVLFRQHARRSLVSVSHGCALVGVCLLGFALCGSLNVVVSVVEGSTA